jgi:hypothetical protein
MAKFGETHPNHVHAELELFAARYMSKKKQLREEENSSTLKVEDEEDTDDPFYGGVDLEALAQEGVCFYARM